MNGCWWLLLTLPCRGLLFAGLSQYLLINRARICSSVLCVVPLAVPILSYHILYSGIVSTWSVMRHSTYSCGTTVSFFVAFFTTLTDSGSVSSHFFVDLFASFRVGYLSPVPRVGDSLVRSMGTVFNIQSSLYTVCSWMLGNLQGPNVCPNLLYRRILIPSPASDAVATSWGKYKNMKSSTWNVIYPGTFLPKLRL